MVKMAEDHTLAGLFAVPGPVFKARYRGKCWLCQQHFPRGERIRYIAKKTVAHEACVVRSGPVNPVTDPVLGSEEWAALVVPFVHEPSDSLRAEPTRVLRGRDGDPAVKWSKPANSQRPAGPWWSTQLSNPSPTGRTPTLGERR
jgi:hypothetical protein